MAVLTSCGLARLVERSVRIAKLTNARDATRGERRRNAHNTWQRIGASKRVRREQQGGETRIGMTARVFEGGDLERRDVVQYV